MIFILFSKSALNWTRLNISTLEISALALYFVVSVHKQSLRVELWQWYPDTACLGLLPSVLIVKPKPGMDSACWRLMGHWSKVLLSFLEAVLELSTFALVTASFVVQAETGKDSPLLTFFPSYLFMKRTEGLGMVVYICNLSIWELQKGGFIESFNQLGLHSKALSLINQSINQSINQPTNQLTKQTNKNKQTLGKLSTAGLYHYLF